MNAGIEVLLAAVAVMSLVLAGFAIWLSWQFYTETRAEGRAISSSISKIENTVVEVKTYVEKVVVQTVDKLLQSQGSETNPQFLELMARLDEMEANVETGDTNDEDDIKDEAKEAFREIKARIADLAEEVKVERIKNALPSAVITPLEKAVTFSHDVTTRKPGLEAGTITVRVNRPINFATVTFPASVKFKNAPTLKVSVISETAQNSISNVTGGLGKGSHDGLLNFHIYPHHGEKLAVGEYMLEYAAHSTRDELGSMNS